MRLSFVIWLNIAWLEISLLNILRCWKDYENETRVCEATQVASVNEKQEEWSATSIQIDVCVRWSSRKSFSSQSTKWNVEVENVDHFQSQIIRSKHAVFCLTCAIHISVHSKYAIDIEGWDYRLNFCEFWRALDLRHCFLLKFLYRYFIYYDNYILR